MLAKYLDNAGIGNTTITVSNVSFPNYDLYVYFKSDNTTVGGTVGQYTLSSQDGTTTIGTVYGANPGPVLQGQLSSIGFGDGSVYRLANGASATTAATDPNAIGNFVVFPNVSLKSFRLVGAPTVYTSAIAGMQIVNRQRACDASPAGYITEAFETLLGRPPNQSELTSFETQYANGNSAAGILTSLTTSQEYKADLLTGYYYRFLRRAPTASEISSLSPSLGFAGGDETAIATIVGSNEYITNFAGGSTSSKFITQAYNDLLGRQPFQSEVIGALAQLDTLPPSLFLRNKILFNTEYQTSLARSYYLLWGAAPPADVSTLLNNGTTYDENFLAQVFQSVACPQSTATGANVTVQPDPNVTVTFDNVIQPGNTTVTLSQTGPPPPAGQVLNGLYYNIGTSAVFAGTAYSGSAKVCIAYNSVQFPTTPSLWHYTGGAWTQISSSSTTTDSQVCGSTKSFSPFALFTPGVLLTAAVSPANSGTVTANPASPNGYYNTGTLVQLTATANTGFVFSGWSGDLSGATNPQSIAINAAHSVTANFVPAGGGGAPGVISVTPAFGNAGTDNFTFQFSHSAGAQNLSVVNVLINNFLDGKHACYLAYIVSISTLALVDDAGDAGGPFAGTVALGNPGTKIQNSQCAVSLTSATSNGNNFTLGLSITLQPSFGGTTGNKIIYLAARDSGSGNTDWQPLGVRQVSYSPPGAISITSTNPQRAAAPAGTAQTYTFTLTDTKGAGDFGVVNVLMNNSLDGKRACYLAYVASINTLVLVNDAGDAGGPFAGVLPVNGSPGTIQNSQCSVDGSGSSATPSGNTLTLVLNLAPKSGVTNRIIWVAGRDTAGGNNTDWQAIGTSSVQ
jgi:hypothetical protein